MNKNELLHIGERNAGHEASGHARNPREDFETPVALETESGTASLSSVPRFRGIQASAFAAHTHQHGADTKEVFVEKEKSYKEIKGWKKVRYYATGSAWLLAGLGILILDNVTLHQGDWFWGIPEIATAFGLYHGYKELNAAWFGHTTRDLSLRGTYREVKEFPGRVINFVKEKLGFKRKDLRG